MNFLSFHGFCAHPAYIFSIFLFSLIGIRLTLNIEKELYWDLISPEYGVRILVHPQGTLPTLQKGGIILNPGKSVHIGIKRVSRSTVVHKLVRTRVKAKTIDTRKSIFSETDTLCFRDWKFKFTNMDLNLLAP